jgi:hypothetical protein
VENNKLSGVRHLRQQGRKFIDQVPRPDHGRLRPRQVNRTFEPSPTFRMIRPHAGQQPPDSVIITDVDRRRIETPSPDDLRDRGRHGKRSGNSAPEKNRGGHLTEGSRSQLIAEPVEEQAQSGARATSTRASGPDGKAGSSTAQRPTSFV